MLMFEISGTQTVSSSSSIANAYSLSENPSSHISIRFLFSLGAQVALRGQMQSAGLLGKARGAGGDAALRRGDLVELRDAGCCI